MLKKIVYLLLVLCVQVSAIGSTMPEFGAARTLVKNDCQFEIDATLLKKMLLSANPFENSLPGITTVQFDVVVRFKAKRYGAQLVFNCVLDPAEHSPRSPSEKIDEENSGGRYFMHVAWERDYKGASWTGKLAYVDYILGDGQQNKVHQYTVCRAPDYRACLTIEITPGVESSARGLAIAISIIDSVRYAAVNGG